MSFLNTRIICNVGTLQELATSTTKGVIYLGVTFNTRTNRNEYFFCVWRPTFTDSNGTVIPAQWVLMTIGGQFGFKMNLSQSFSDLDKISFAGDDAQFYGLYGGILANVITNDGTIKATSSNLSVLVTAADPTAYNILGGGITTLMVQDLTGVTNDIVPTPNDPTSTVISLKDVSKTYVTVNGTETDIETLALDVTDNYVDTVVTAFANPIDFVKKNPVSGALIGVVAYEGLALLTGLWPGLVTGKKPILGKVLGLKKGRR